MRKKSFVQNLSLFTFSLIVCLTLLEILALVLSRSGIIEMEAPKHQLFSRVDNLVEDRMPFWGDHNPHFSKWYPVNDTLARVSCQGDSLFSYTNSYGARDKNREERSAGKRVAMLGDSFIEGFMVNADQRMSDLLEAATGLEHLNFGINGTSPINYYLTYRHLVRRFDHDVVIAGILPANDFEDFTSEKKASLVERPIYRPYWDGEYPRYTLKYSLASIDHSTHSAFHFSNPERISSVIDSVFFRLSPVEKIEAALQDNSYTWNLIKWAGEQIRPAPPADFTRFNSYSREEWNIFSYSLEQLFREAGDKKVILLLLPLLDDIKAYDLAKENRLASSLDSLISDYPNVGVIDFLPVMHAQSGKWEQFFVPCDGHWTKEGEKFASEIVLNHPLYRAALGEEATSGIQR